ncbi:MAG: DMT family transporter [Pirellulales bacterium]|nr:DMT family transporter [Pirellulales bacterium]
MPPWLVWTILALVSWGIWAALSKALGDAVTPRQCQAYSTLGILPILGGLGFSEQVKIEADLAWSIWYAFFGGLITCAGNLFYYAALARGSKVATAVSLTALYPVVTVLLAVTVLNERLNSVQVIGLFLSLGAIWLINIAGEGSVLSSVNFLALLPIVLWGWSGFMEKVATLTLTGETAAMFYLGAFLPVGLYFALTEPWPRGLTVNQWLILLAVGFLLAFGNYAVLMAFAYQGKAAVIAPITSLYPMISIPLAVLFFREWIGPREGVGITLALLAVLALTWEFPQEVNTARHDVVLAVGR